MATQRESKVIQIIPATGWRYRVMQKDDTGFEDDVACWALVEDEDGKRNVVGLSGADHLEVIEEMRGFSGYIGPGGFNELDGMGGKA